MTPFVLSCFVLVLLCVTRRRRRPPFVDGRAAIAIARRAKPVLRMPRFSCSCGSTSGRYRPGVSWTCARCGAVRPQ